MCARVCEPRIGKIEYVDEMNNGEGIFCYFSVFFLFCYFFDPRRIEFGRGILFETPCRIEVIVGLSLFCSFCFNGYFFFIISTKG